MFSIHYLMSQLPQFDTLSISPSGKTFSFVERLRDNAFYDPATVYIMYASELPGLICAGRPNGLMIIEDAAFHPEFSNCDMVLLRADTDILRLEAEAKKAAAEADSLSPLQSLMSFLLESEVSPDHKLCRAARYMGQPILLFDVGGKLLALSGRDELAGLPDADLCDALQTGDLLASSTAAQRERYLHTLRRLKPGGLPFVESREDCAHRRLYAPICFNAALLGFLMAVEVNGTFGPFHISFLSLLARLIAVGFPHRRESVFFQGTGETLFLHHLYEQRFFRRTDVETRVANFGWELRPILFALVVSSFDERIDQTMGRTSALDFIGRQLLQCFPFARACIRQSNICLLVSVDSMDQINRGLAKMEPILQEHCLYAGSSRNFSNILEFRKYCDYAERVLKIGSILYPEQTVVRPFRVAFNLLLSYQLDGAELSDFVFPGLITLEEYDRANNTEYLASLYEYLRCGQNMPLAAQRLFIHRNTLAHRLERISRIANISLDSGDDLFQVFWSIKLQEHIRMFGADGNGPLTQNDGNK